MINDLLDRLYNLFNRLIKMRRKMNLKYRNKTNPNDILEVIHSAVDYADEIVYSCIDPEGNGIFYMTGEDMDNEYDLIEEL